MAFLDAIRHLRGKPPKNSPEFPYKSDAFFNNQRMRLNDQFDSLHEKYMFDAEHFMYSHRRIEHQAKVARGEAVTWKNEVKKTYVRKGVNEFEWMAQRRELIRQLVILEDGHSVARRLKEWAEKYEEKSGLDTGDDEI